MLAVLMVPGPTLALIARNTAQRGKRSGLKTALGVATGKSCLALLILILLSTVLAFVEAYGHWLRWMGAGYIVLAAVRAWRSNGISDRSERPCEGDNGVFLQGFVIAISSPITILFLSTQIPSFVDTALAVPPQLAILALSYLFCALAFEVVCVFAVTASSRRRLAGPSFVLSPKGSAVCLFGIATVVSPLGVGIGI